MQSGRSIKKLSIIDRPLKKPSQKYSRSPSHTGLVPAFHDSGIWTGGSRSIIRDDTYF